MVTAGQDGTAIVWEVASDKRSPAFTGHRGPVNSAAFSPDGKQVVTAGYDRRVLAWNPEDVKPFDFKNVAEGTVVHVVLLSSTRRLRVLQAPYDFKFT